MSCTFLVLTGPVGAVFKRSVVLQCRERPDVHMQLVAVDFLPPQVLQQQMLRVSSLLAAGHITPLCTANYSLTSVVAAMRLLAQASHVGKVCTGHDRGRLCYMYVYTCLTPLSGPWRHCGERGGCQRPLHASLVWQG